MASYPETDFFYIIFSDSNDFLWNPDFLILTKGGKMIFW